MLFKEAERVCEGQRYAVPIGKPDSNHEAKIVCEAPVEPRIDNSRFKDNQKEKGRVHIVYEANSRKCIMGDRPVCEGCKISALATVLRGGHFRDNGGIDPDLSNS